MKRESREDRVRGEATISLALCICFHTEFNGQCKMRPDTGFNWITLACVVERVKIRKSGRREAFRWLIH